MSEETAAISYEAHAKRCTEEENIFAPCLALFCPCGVNGSPNCDRGKLKFVGPNKNGTGGFIECDSCRCGFFLDKAEREPDGSLSKLMKAVEEAKKTEEVKDEQA